MSKLFVTQIADETMTVVAETSNEKTARVSYHNTCKNLWNDANTDTAIVEIVDEGLNTWGGYHEDINKLSDYPAYDEEIEYSKGAIVNYESKDYEYINDEASKGNLPTDTDYWQEFIPSGKLFVMTVANNSLIKKDITEWDRSKTGVKGAMVNFHTKCATYWNADDVITANVKILNEALDGYKSEFIFHAVEE